MKHLITLWEMVLKHFKIIGRSKTTLLTVFMGPLLIIFIVGLAFNNQTLQNINLGLYINTSLNESNYLDLDFENPAISQIYAILNESFIVEYTDSQGSCINGVKTGIYHACLELPFELNPEDRLSDNYLNIFVDLSQINLAYSLLNDISETVSVETKRLSLLFTEKLLSEIENTEFVLEADNVMMLGLEDTMTTINDNLLQAQTDLDSMMLVTEDIDELEQIPTLVSTLSMSLEDYDLLSNEILYDYQTTQEELLSLEEEYDDACWNSSSTYCDELFENINNLEDKSTMLSYYINYISSNENITDIADELLILSDQATTTLDNINNNVVEAENLRVSAIKFVEDGSLDLEMAVLDLSTIGLDITTVLDGFSQIQIKDSEKIINPMNISIQTVTKEGTFLDYSFPLLIILVICFLGILLSSNIVMIEKKSSAFFRNHITPVKEFMFLASIFIVMLIIMIVDVVIVMLVASIFFNFNTSITTLPALLPAILIISSAFILIGMSIGFIFKDEEGATMTSIFLSTILFLFSPIVIPLENMSVALSKIAGFSPLVLGLDVLKKIILFEIPLFECGIKVLFLCIYVIIFILLIFFTYQSHKKTM
ncbi:MAG: ABC transporter permease [Nanoarchaeota archaeon]|nr:ABC transporter permease [Nanoarchaeota archaeon]MBU1029649.1 ABC transporter permease [Nanoarchaeota archaeon]MBU1849181.1 ABC transporter permease [Nanoarchaeota archaeon]